MKTNELPEPPDPRQAALTRRLFNVGVIIKGLDGVFEAFVGSVVLLEGASVGNWISMWISHRPEDRSGDVIATLLAKIAVALSGDTRRFIVLYLLGHGATKMFLAVNLLRRRMWAFPVAIVLFGLFVVYQLHRYLHTHSGVLLTLALLDVVIVGLIWREWQLRLREARADRALAVGVRGDARG